MSIAKQYITAAKMMVTSEKTMSSKKTIALEVTDGLWRRPRGTFHAGVAARARGSLDR